MVFGSIALEQSHMCDCSGENYCRSPEDMFPAKKPGRERDLVVAGAPRSCGVPRRCLILDFTFVCFTVPQNTSEHTPKASLKFWASLAMHHFETHKRSDLLDAYTGLH